MSKDGLEPQGYNGDGEGGWLWMVFWQGFGWFHGSFKIMIYMILDWTSSWLRIVYWNGRSCQKISSFSVLDGWVFNEKILHSGSFYLLCFSLLSHSPEDSFWRLSNFVKHLPRRRRFIYNFPFFFFSLLQRQDPFLLMFFLLFFVWEF